MKAPVTYSDLISEKFAVPAQARTRSGVIFDPREDKWGFREGLTDVLIGFDSWGLVDSELKTGFKLALVWQLGNRSPKHVLNMYSRSKQFFLYVANQFQGLPVEISDEHLISYATDPAVLKKGYLSSLSGFLKQWHELGYPGVSKRAVDYLKSARLKGNEKGGAIRTMDPISGPLTIMETEALLDALSDAFRDKRVSVADYLLAWLVIAIGMRPVQYAALKVCDLKVIKTKGSDETFMLSIPRAKQRGVIDMRSIKKDRAILPEVGKLMLRHIQDVKRDLQGKIPEVDQAPLFPAQSVSAMLQGTSAITAQPIWPA